MAPRWVDCQPAEFTARPLSRQLRPAIDRPHP